MNILESLIYGFISGLSEFLPISSQGHQSLLKILFGVNSPEPLRDILVHIAVLCAVVFCCGTYFQNIKREFKVGTYSTGNRKAHYDRQIAWDVRLIKSAAVPMIFLLFLNLATVKLQHNLGFLALFFTLNGIVLYLPEHISQSNRASSQMSAFDSLLIGAGSALSVMPGISRTGAALSLATMRGADKEKAYNWILALSVPALAVLLICDIVSIFIVGFGYMTFLSFLGCLLSAAAAFGGAIAGLSFMRILLSRSGFTFFGFYCWGAALLSFLLYLFA